MEFAIVEFTADKSVGVIPTNWLLDSDKMCYWPAKPTGIDKLAKGKATPEANWMKYAVKVNHKYGKLLLCFHVQMRITVFCKMFTNFHVNE